jgi:8-oxo-dGTP pyrophosphatase MutT (NUDIX family)
MTTPNPGVPAEQSADLPITLPADLPDWMRALAMRAPDMLVPPPMQLPQSLRREIPADGSGRQSAVLVCIGETAGQPDLLLLERASTLRAHAGQIAFPGGARDPGDASLIATALREADEEVGLDRSSAQPLIALPPRYIPRSDFVVTPVLAWWRRPHAVEARDRREVESVRRIPLRVLADPANRFTVSSPGRLVGPGFEVDGWFIWGFTAWLVSQLLDAGGWGLPYDTTIQRPVPAARWSPTVSPRRESPVAPGTDDAGMPEETDDATGDGSDGTSDDLTDPVDGTASGAQALTGAGSDPQ